MPTARSRRGPLGLLDNAAYQRELIRLRRAKLPELALHGDEGIAGYLTRLGLTNRAGDPVTVRTVKLWRQELGLPYWRVRGGTQGRVMSSLSDVALNAPR